MPTVSGIPYLRRVTKGSSSLPDNFSPDGSTGGSGLPLTALPDDLPLAVRPRAYIRGRS